MSDNALTREFEAVLQGEPPLGFDPDDVVTVAARRQRWRRASVLAGVGVAAVVVAAVAVPAALARAPEAASPDVTSTIGDWPPAGTSWPRQSQQRLTTQQVTSLGHLNHVLPELVPGWTSTKHDYGTAGTFVTEGPGKPAPLVQQQGFGNDMTVRAGDRVIDVYVTVRVPLGTNPPTPLAQQCATERAGTAHGDKVTCTTSKLADGSVLVAAHNVMAFKPGAAVTNGRHLELLVVQNFRPDGTEVDAESEITLGAPASHVLPTIAQLTTLAVDPAFRVTR
ncbi:MAG TPA: hypothetical protein VGL80_07410 [Pseudonocardiaceae bacterium]|jgi:hypothetical protein